MTLHVSEGGGSWECSFVGVDCCALPASGRWARSLKKDQQTAALLAQNLHLKVAKLLGSLHALKDLHSFKVPEPGVRRVSKTSQIPYFSFPSNLETICGVTFHHN